MFWAAVVAVLVAIFGVLLPKALARPIGRLIQLLLTKLTHAQLIAICMAAVAFLPCTLFLPMQPFIWIAGEYNLGWVFSRGEGGCPNSCSPKGTSKDTVFSST